MSILSIHEEHGEVLATWHALGLRNATVLCFDRHLDLKAIGARSLERIDAAASDSAALARLNRPIPFQEDAKFAYGLDNFILAAGRLNLLKRFIWVYPEPRPLTSKELAAILWNRLSLVAGHGKRILSTFEVRPEGVCAEVGDVAVQITTPRRLAAIHLPAHTHVDVDLDFFGTEQGEILHRPSEILEITFALGLSDLDPTLTWSITSGFLPDELAWVGCELAAGFGREAAPRTRTPLAPRTMRLLTAGTALSRQQVNEIVEEELEPLGAAGHSLGSVLWLQVNPDDLHGAADLWEKARAGGDGASWPAYAMGLAWMKRGDYAKAALWFDRGRGEQIDTIQLHGSCMHAICLARMERWEEALKHAQDLAEIVPMRREPFTVARTAAIALDRCELAGAIALRAPKPPFEI